MLPGYAANGAAAKQIAAAFAAAGRSLVEALTARRLVHHYDWKRKGERREGEHELAGMP